MSIYPSLEDMKVDQLHQAQIQHERSTNQMPQLVYPQATGSAPLAPVQEVPRSVSPSLYPSLGEYMGLQLPPEMVQEMQVANVTPMPVAVPTQGGKTVVAPITGNNKGLARAEIKHGIRPVILCKDENGKLGLRVRHVNNGLFVALVQNNSPAALAGLRFGDQILQIDGKTVAGWDNDKAHKVFKAADPRRIELAVRDRPFERTITLQKDSVGYIGFVFNNGRIKSLVKDSSAARNGVLTDHQLIEVNGQNVVGLKDTEIGEIIDAGGRTVTITIMPCFVYDHIKKCMGNSLIKKLMDHSIPDL
ncbi:hypothetical protein LOTGIDRAFT_186095 [Lottia gigantea]|uniref:PDZ domain-containing protein n=1 Tax=Lottia gigantea TaxID=225164 RepID=V4B1R0_LOTGI|nr:hypothetical protein LOTGIDRAFT_186095 [Lottia gigantea]ESP01261.1 hypothetical protein LOTGIDRAFT_186095 [Lottia gigantea]